MLNSSNLLYIVTDLEDQRWLVYLLEEFKRSNKFQAEFKILHERERHQARKSAVIYYTRRPIGSVSLINQSHVMPDGDIVFVSDQVFVIKGTTAEQVGYICPYDLLWNAFVYISRLEEFLYEKSAGKNIDSYLRRHPRKYKDSFTIPVVNNLFNTFEKIIHSYYPHLEFGDDEQPVLELSHNVEYIEKTWPLRISQTISNISSTSRNLARPSLFMTHLGRTVRFPISNSSYWQFDYWEQIEREMNQRSVFYIYAHIPKNDLRSWILDPSYDIKMNSRMKDQLKQLLDQGFEIGLYGSCHSATQEELLQSEKEKLEHVIGQTVKKVRQHRLRYQEITTPYLHHQLFPHDSTVGWIDRMGFRSGCLNRYRPFDHINKRPFGFFETPLVMMDSHSFDDRGGEEDRQLVQAVRFIKLLFKYKTSYISICWNQRVSSPDYGRHKVYEEILKQFQGQQSF